MPSSVMRSEKQCRISLDLKVGVGGGRVGSLVPSCLFDRAFQKLEDLISVTEHLGFKFPLLLSLVRYYKFLFHDSANRPELVRTINISRFAGLCSHANAPRKI